MKTRAWWGLTFGLCAALFLAPLTSSVRAAETVKPAVKPTAKLSSGEKAGIKLAESISLITGVAISPLLGVGTVGAWQWYHADATQRAQLPWFAQPWFWIPALLLVALVIFKDALGTSLPASLKKPFDIAEAVENKVSALVVAGAVIPIIAAVSAATATAPPTSAFFSEAGFAAIDSSWLLNILTVPAAIAVFLIVWLVSHTINVLILISPFGAVDALLKLFRMAILSSVVLTAWANPYLGAAWCLVLIVICYFLSGWSFRMLVFGTVFTWDLVTFRHRRCRPAPARNWMFLARKTDKVPVRTFGRLSRNNEGRLELAYRPWLVMPARTLTLPEGRYAIGRGLLYPELMRLEGEEEQTAFRLPPRYRSHEEDLTRILALEPVQDVGLKAMWRWLKDVFGFKGRELPAAPAASVAST